MALLDCAINKKCCTVDGGRGICPLFFFPTPGNWPAEESPPPGICHPRLQGKKNANSRGSARGAWAQVELTDA